MPNKSPSTGSSEMRVAGLSVEDAMGTTECITCCKLMAVAKDKSDDRPGKPNRAADHSGLPFGAESKTHKK